jgi:hypothetical protein
MYTTGKYKFTYAVDGGYDTTAVRRNGDVNALRAEGGLYGKIKSGYWRTKAYFYNSERGYPGAVVRNRFSHEDRQWDTNFFLQSSLKKDFGDVYSLLLNAKYAYDYQHYLADPQKEEATMYVNNTYRQQEVYLSMANRVTLFPFWDINISADYQWNKLNANLTDFPYPRRNTALVAAATSLHFERFKLQASVLGTFVNENVASDTTSAGNKMEFTPTVITSYKPFKNIDLSLHFPSAKEASTISSFGYSESILNVLKYVEIHNYLKKLSGKKVSFPACAKLDGDEKPFIASLPFTLTAEEKKTIVLYESPHKINTTLEQIKEFFGEETRVSLSREISKKFEETKRGTINELIEFSKSKTLKGEIVLIVNNSF